MGLREGHHVLGVRKVEESRDDRKKKEKDWGWAGRAELVARARSSRLMSEWRVVRLVGVPQRSHHTSARLVVCAFSAATCACLFTGPPPPSPTVLEIEYTETVS